MYSRSLRQSVVALSIAIAFCSLRPRSAAKDQGWRSSRVRSSARLNASAGSNGGGMYALFRQPQRCILAFGLVRNARGY
eukprot:8533509-Pyramimonas_sp.AAC.1